VKLARVTIAVLLVTLLPSCGLAQFEGGTYRPMQEDFDRLRLDHLLVIAKLMNEYKSKVGHLPLADRADGKPVAVIIASEEQLANDKGRVPITLDLKSRERDGKVPETAKRIERLTVNELTKELEAVLGRTISLPIDPQRVPANKPSVYVYTCYLDVYDVSAFLHSSFPFSRKLGAFNYRIAVGSRSNPKSAVWTADDLIAQPEFKKFFQAPFNKPGFKVQTKIEQVGEP
jgi:hypothetical protein